MPKEINISLILPIPKISNSSTVNPLKPIIPCNVIYKIISKIIVAKLIPLLDKIISLGYCTGSASLLQILENKTWIDGYKVGSTKGM